MSPCIGDIVKKHINYYIISINYERQEESTPFQGKVFLLEGGRNYVFSETGTHYFSFLYFFQGTYRSLHMYGYL